MSGSIPAQSPTQKAYPPPYSPTHSSGRPFYNHEYQSLPPQHLMQTPPPFAPTSVAHSPHQARRSSITSPLPAPSHIVPHPGNVTSPYQQTSSPPYSLQRTYSGHLVQTAMAGQYERPPSSHSHPTSRQSSLQSPLREHRQMQNGNPREPPTNDSRPSSHDVSPLPINYPQSLADMCYRNNIGQAIQCHSIAFLGLLTTSLYLRSKPSPCRMGTLL